MNAYRNNSVILMSSILGKRVGNNPSNIKLTQDLVRKNNGPFDSSVQTRRKKLLTVINSRR
jgi:hypothetical protein